MECPRAEGKSMMIFTYAKIAVIVAIIAVCGYFVINYKHMQHKIAAQEIEIANLNLEKDVLEKKNKALEEFTAKKTVIKGKVVYVERQVDQDVASGDVARVLDMFHKLQSNKIQPPPDGGTGSSKPKPGRAPNSRLN